MANSEVFVKVSKAKQQRDAAAPTSLKPINF